MIFKQISALVLFALAVTQWQLLSGEQAFTAGIAFLIADVKYNKESIKFCEVQQGSLSRNRGHDHLNGQPGSFAEKFSHFILRYQKIGWYVESDIQDRLLRKDLKNNGWIPLEQYTYRITDSRFLEKASQPVNDPYNLYDYHGILYARPHSIGLMEKFKKRYPGIIVLDEPTFSYWADKYKMNLLFSDSKELEKYRPKWGLYTKKYTKNLAHLITNELQSEIFVIKPRNAADGKGVIIIGKEDLDKTLKNILKHKKKLKHHPDYSYNYWARDPFDTFIVEEFIASDTLRASDFDNRYYDPTMRVACLLFYHQKEIEVVFLHKHCQLPHKSLSEEGSLNEKHKGGPTPHYVKVPSYIWDGVEEELRKAFTLLFQQMLGICQTRVGFQHFGNVKALAVDRSQPS